MTYFRTGSLLAFGLVLLSSEQVQHRWLFTPLHIIEDSDFTSNALASYLATKLQLFVGIIIHSNCKTASLMYRVHIWTFEFSNFGPAYAASLLRTVFITVTTDIKNM